MSLRVSRGGWGWGWGWLGGWSVDERSLGVDSRPRTEFKDGEHLQIAGEGARQAQVMRDEESS